MESLFNDFESTEVINVINTIVDNAANYDIYDVISRVAGLNLLSENQNKAVLTDTFIQYIISKTKGCYKSSIEMSDKRFKMLIEELNQTSLAAAIDPCENTFVQNVMLNGENYRVFNGIDITPAYNLQSLIRILFKYKNGFDSNYLDRVNRLFALLLGISEDIASSLDIRIDNVHYNEEHKIIVPSSEIVKRNANRISIPVHRFKRFADNYFDLDDLCIDFGKNEKGNIDNRPFYTRPFLKNENKNELIILNISLLPAFAFYKALEWAELFGIKKEVIRLYNELLWIEVRKDFKLMGHKKIDEKAYGIECVCNDYYKESILTVYNNQLMLVFFLCDDGIGYSARTMHSKYPNDCHEVILRKRLQYYLNNLNNLKTSIDDIFCVFITGSIGRNLRVKSEESSLTSKSICLNGFELHCIEINERKNKPFLPRYIRARNQLHTMPSMNFFSELNAISIYTSNHNSFYMSDDFDPTEIEIYIAPGDSVEYISDALCKENRMLIDSYDDGNKTEVMLVDSTRNIYSEDPLFLPDYLAFCVILKNIKIWIKTEIITEYNQVNIFNSLVDAISYWMAECKLIIDKYSFPYAVYTIHLSISENFLEYQYYDSVVTAFEECIDQTTERNHIYLVFKPEAYLNLNQIYNDQEKELIRYIIDIFDNIAYENRDYSDDFDYMFKNRLKKKFFSANYDNRPYYKPLIVQNNRIVHTEDEDYLSGIIGKELLKSGQWKIGTVNDCQRKEIANTVVEWLYNRLEAKVAEFESDHMLEVIYQDVEEVLYRLLIAEKKFYSDVACYPEKEKNYLEENNNLNKTSLSLKFLLEYVTARPPLGSKHLGIGQYEELLAICSLIVDWAYKGDLFYYGIVNTPVTFLKSKRIGMKHDEFLDIYQYSNIYRQRQLKYDSSYLLRKQYTVKKGVFIEELESAFRDEFGYSYSDFFQVVVTMANMDELDVICISQSELEEKLIELNDKLTKSTIDTVLRDITYCPRNDFLKMPDGYNKEDAFPWRFNRKYSFNRRPVLKRGNELIFGTRQIYHMAEYVTDLIYSGKFKANCNSLKTLCGKITKAQGAAFNDLIVQMLQDMKTFKLYPNVKKINGKRIADDRGDLGDIDVLIIDEDKNKIIVTEIKNFRFSKNPREIKLEYDKMFVDNENKLCFATKHNKRKKWVEDNLNDVKTQYRLDNRPWIVTSLFIVNQPLISSHIYKINIKCISIAELCVDAIHEA